MYKSIIDYVFIAGIISSIVSTIAYVAVALIYACTGYMGNEAIIDNLYRIIIISFIITVVSSFLKICIG